MASSKKEACTCKDGKVFTQSFTARNGRTVRAPKGKVFVFNCRRCV